MVCVSVDPPIESDQQDDLEVRAHVEFATAYKDGAKVYAISDGGADSCVLGQNAHVLHETGRYATLIGMIPTVLVLLGSPL